MDSDTVDCGHCALVTDHVPAAADQGGVSSSELALYVGLSLAVIVFLVVILVALSLLRRRRLPSGYRLTQSG